MQESGSAIDFERAEYGGSRPSAAPCGQCKQPIEGQYWTLGRNPICGRCHARIEATVSQAASAASLGKATLQGGAVALACGVGYAIFTALTHWQMGLVTIGIAFVIAKVVRKASGGIGGLRFQILAVALTYLASAMGYLSPVVSMIYDHQPAVHHLSHTSEAVAPTDAQDPAPPSGGVMFVALVKLTVRLLGYALAAPLTEAFQAPVGLLIVGFGLWEAWKLTRAVPVVFDGPYRMGQAAGATPPS
jgi:hypothetical protein